MNTLVPNAPSAEAAKAHEYESLKQRIHNKLVDKLDLTKVGDGHWTFKPATDGSYSFNCEATKGGKTTTCSTDVRVGKANPVCDIDVAVDPDTNMISIDSSAEPSEIFSSGL